MTVKEFLTISSIATEPEVIRTKLDELRKPYQLGQYKTPDTLNDINMGELMQLQSIETEHDILFVPCTVLMGLSNFQLAMYWDSYNGWPKKLNE